jgi:hypothetical protein
MAGKVNKTSIKAPAVRSDKFIEPRYAPSGVAKFPKNGATKKGKP